MPEYRWTQADVDAVNARRGRKQPLEGSESPQDARSSDQATPKPSKYRNVKVVVDGRRFDSGREADYWLFLKARQTAGEITELRPQVHFPLYCPVMQSPAGAVRILQVAEYIADFTYQEAGKLVVVDAKARRISPYSLKAKWLALQQGIEIVEV